MKKILAIILSLVIFTSMAVTSFATVTPVAPTTLKSFTFTDESLPSGFLANYSAGTIKRALDGSEGVLSVSTDTSGDSDDYNFNFENSSTLLEVSGEIALTYDVKIVSVADGFNTANPVVNPHLVLTQSGGTYIEQKFLPSAYFDSVNNKIVFKASSVTSEENNFTNYDSFTGDINKWYTVKYVINTGAGSIKTYVIDRETGDRAFVSEKTGLTISTLARLNFTARGSATYYMDNINVYSNIATQSKIVIDSFDTMTGLSATVNLSDDVKKAELKADGNLLETIENTGSGTYKVTNASLKSTVKAYKLDLICYDSANNVINTVTNTIKSNVILSNILKSETGEQSIASTGTTVLEFERKTSSIIETQYEIQFESKPGKFEQYSKLFNSAGASGWGPTITVPVTGINSNIWYTIRTVYDSKKYVYEAYINDGSGEQMLANGAITRQGYFHTQVAATGTPKIRNAYVKDILAINGTDAVSYANYVGATLEIGETIPSSAKSVNISLGDLTLSSLDGVKLYKDGIEITDIEKNVSGNVLTVAPTAFEAGNYKVIVTGTTYGGNATNLVFEEEFEVENKFEVLTPQNGAKLPAEKFTIAISTLNCEKLEIYANDVLKDTAENPPALYSYEYTPENFGTAKIDAVATLSDGTKETDTVFVDISGKILTYNENRSIAYFAGDSSTKFTSATEGITDYDGNQAYYFSVPASAADTKLGYVISYTASNTETAAKQVNGEVRIKYNIKFDGASKLALRTETRSYKEDGKSTYDPYPMNSKYMFEYGTITKRPSSLNEKYTYDDGKWYEVEYVINMKSKKQSAFIKDLETGTTTTLADNIDVIKSNFGANETGDLLGDGFGLYSFKFNLFKGATTDATGFTISNIAVSNYEDIPVMTNITHGENISDNGMIEECNSIKVALSSNLYDSDLASFVTLTKNGVSEEAEITYADGMLTITPTNGFIKNNRYKVIISGDATVKSKKITIPVSKEITVAEDGLFISPLKIAKGDTAGTYKAELSYYNYGETTEDGILVIASYSGNKMNKIALSRKNKFTKGYGVLNAEISGVASGETVKAMLWNNTSSLSPMVGSLDITAE